MEGAGTTATIADNLIRAHVETGEIRAADAAAPTGVLVLDGARATIDRNNLVDNRRAEGGGAAVIIADGGDGSQVVSYNNIDRNDVGVSVDGRTPSRSTATRSSTTTWASRSARRRPPTRTPSS